MYYFTQEDPTMLQGSSYAFHGVHINPCDSRLLVTGKKKAQKV